MADIYYIQNMNTGKQYVGQTAKSYHKRCKRHFTELVNGTHSNEYLQNAYAKEPAAFITGSLLVDVCPATVTDLEIHYIKLLKTAEPKYGYNLTHGGEGGIPTEETRKKMCAAQKGKTASAETRAKMSVAQMGSANHNYGKTVSAETRAKMCAAQMGRTHSAETRAKLSVAQMGKTVSTETKAKLSAANKGKKLSAETRAKMSEAKKGRKRSAETRAKISVALTKRRQFLPRRHYID